MHVALRTAADVGGDKPATGQREGIVEEIGKERFVVAVIAECEPLPVHPDREVGRPAAHGTAPDEIKAQCSNVDVDGMHDQL